MCNSGETKTPSHRDDSLDKFRDKKKASCVRGIKIRDEEKKDVK